MPLRTSFNPYRQRSGRQSLLVPNLRHRSAGGAETGAIDQSFKPIIDAGSISVDAMGGYTVFGSIDFSYYPIGSTAIGDGQIIAQKIGANAIVSSKISAGTILSSHIKAEQITSSKIAAGTILASNIKNNVITSNKMNVGSLSAISANLGNVTSGTITSGRIRTSSNVGAGNNGVDLNADGLKVYNAVLGIVVNLPSSGSAPLFSSGYLQSSVYEMTSTSIIRTSSTVGDGSAASQGILINPTGVYGCGTNQVLGSANFKILSADGSVRLKGEIVADSGTIGGFTILNNLLSGGNIDSGIITGTEIRSAATGQRTVISSEGIKFLTGLTTGKYNDGTNYNSGTKYGSGVLAWLNSPEKKVPIYIQNETVNADIKLSNRVTLPSAFSEVGCLAFKNGTLYACTVEGTPGSWTPFAYSS